jgi:hypothetical protein
MGCWLQGVNLDRSQSSFRSIDILQLVDVWDPKVATNQFKDVLQELKGEQADGRLLVVDSLSCICSILQGSAAEVLHIIHHLTALVRCFFIPSRVDCLLVFSTVGDGLISQTHNPNQYEHICLP